jgi:hypothetical protein
MRSVVPYVCGCCAVPLLDELVAPTFNNFDGRCMSMESVSGELDAVRVVLC